MLMADFLSGELCKAFLSGGELTARGLLVHLKNAFDFLKSCRVLIGREPRNDHLPVLIIFPVSFTACYCGFAGILTLRRRSNSPEVNGSLAEVFKRAAEKNLPSVLSGLIPPSSYLGGINAQRELERELLRLKEESVWKQIFYDTAEAQRLQELCVDMKDFLAGEEKILEEHAVRFTTAQLEEINRGLIVIRDLKWGIEKDIIDNVSKICALAGVDHVAEITPVALPKYHKINFLLNSLNCLEIRGRDSAGVQISFAPEDNADISGIWEGLREKGFSEDLKRRAAAGDAVDGSIVFSFENAGQKNQAGNAISFTYKTAQIVGELGRNVKELRKKIAADSLFHAFANIPSAFETAFAHTRWASVGSITEENCHPIGNFTLSGDDKKVPEKNYPAYGKGFWTINVVLNGDIDNYKKLMDSFYAAGGAIAPELTTDAKVIPLQIEKYLYDGHDLAEAFRLAVRDFEGSHAIAMVSNAEPGKVFLALKGSGQAIYVGIAPERYLFSSELYGLVEETPFFIKMDGEKTPSGGNANAKGQIFILDHDVSGGAAGIQGIFYDKTPVELGEETVQRAEITTRDIDRGEYPHYFLKEINESVLSVRKTLRGKYRIQKLGAGEKAGFSLGEDVIPEEIREGLLRGKISRIVIIGHGTAAVAGSAVAGMFEKYLRGSGIFVQAMLASELSGFCLEHDLNDTLVIPITQSGTTTDTNRAAAMAKDRGARIIAIVNRRQSDITAKADGVFYTSDGRDIEMAVASTKAFYSQIVAGSILALSIAGLVSALSGEQTAKELRLLEKTPELMEKVLAQRNKIKAAVERTVNRKRYWAVVGSGPNKAAADEIRIKLSELCYLTISSDVVENKKHIDLSAEPLIVVCAAGSPESVVGDIVKDVAIFKAHKSAVVVFADEQEERFDMVADAVIGIPRAPLPLPVILNTVAGHLFGYYAACSIDEDALYLREFKSRLNLLVAEQAKRNLSVYESLADESLQRIAKDFTDGFLERKNSGRFSQAGINTISDLVLLLKYTGGKLPVDDFRHDFPGHEGMSSIDLLDETLGHAVDELSRPIDAIRHQAKTVTVGTSRKEVLPEGIITDLLLDLSFGVHSLAGTNILLLGRLQKAALSINGYTLYVVDKLDRDGKPGDDAIIWIKKRGGVSRQMHSRIEKSRSLIGTKKGIVATGRIYAGRGKSDGAPIVIVPLLGNKERIENLLLLHVTFNEKLSVRERREILGEKENDIMNLVQECNLSWNENLLGDIPLGVLLGEPVEVIVGRIKQNMQGNG
jgi:glucosamine--fructose-6-phosphate aminotransferase (isomerizing)